MLFKALSMTAFVATALAVALPVTTRQGDSGLSFEVPPPACLENCIHQYGACALCATNDTIQACLDSTCGRDISYAEAYYGSICQDQGYVSYDFNPPQDIYIASHVPTNCQLIPASQ